MISRLDKEGWVGFQNGKWAKNESGEEEERKVIRVARVA